ncbi:MAG: hypothetical protein IJ896_10690 [Fibrobacter sp.]|nr:hypothetical protein [Fibrobacter sp.]
MAGKVLEKAYAVYPSVKMYKKGTDSETQEVKLKFDKELLFGDTIYPAILKSGDYSRTIIEGEEYIRVSCRRHSGYIKESDMQEQPVLEVNFIDVGQGDGCHIVTPDDKHFVVDAGGSNNMFRFLRWRFSLKDSNYIPPKITAVISHSDSDHYLGFQEVFTPHPELKQQLSFEKVYHNGIVEAAGTEMTSLGTKLSLKGEGYDYNTYITDLCDTPEDYEKRVDSLKGRRKGGIGDYITTLNMTSAPKQSLRRGSDPIYDDCGVKMEIMGPIAETINGKAAFPSFGSVGETKNGHSVIIKLTMGHMRILLGGDLNTKSEYYLIKKYSGVDIKAKQAEMKLKRTSESRKQELEKEIKDAIKTTNDALGVDIAKSCHHGSSDFSTEFLDVLNPIVTVVSSGDDEPYAHPRPDTLGTIGKHSRGERSLIFCTELARSGKEFVKIADIKNKDDEEAQERVVTVYGMINVRTDGEKAIIAQKLERYDGKKNWDIHELKWNAKKGEFEYIQGK